jgi:LysM repeat protein
MRHIHPRSSVQKFRYRSPIHLFIIIALLVGAISFVPLARAQNNPCGPTYTVLPGDNLTRIAIQCETTVAALLAANPQVVDPSLIFAGQVLTIPDTDTIPDTGAPATIYTVRSGDTLSEIAFRHGTSLNALLLANPHITDPSLIFTGQVLTIPGVAVPPAPAPPGVVIPDTGPGERLYTVVSGDTLGNIAFRHGTTTADLIQRNPHIVNPNLIFPGQRIAVPIAPVVTPVPVTPPSAVIPDTGPGEQLYTVRTGDTMSGIAFRHGITTANLIQRNPHIVNPNLIFPGQRLAVPAVTPAPTPVPPTPVAPTPTPPPAAIPDTGEIIFQDDFSVTGIWFTADEPNFRIGYAEGGYRIMNNFANSYVSSIRTLTHADIFVETEATRVGGPETGYYGVVCRWQDINNFYAMVIGSDGFHGIVRLVNGQVNFLSEGRTTDGPINLGSATNRIGGSCIGNTLTLFVNGEQLLQTLDNTFGSGSVGLMVGTRTAAGTHVHFDNFALRR